MSCNQLGFFFFMDTGEELAEHQEIYPEFLI